MAIEYIHPETGDKVDKEPWRWRAIYIDGSSLPQFELRDGKAIFHRFAEIDMTRIVSLRLEHDTHPAIEVLIPLGSKPVHFYRNAILQHTQRHESGQEFTWEEKVRWYVIGFEAWHHKWLMAVTDDNRIIMTSDPDKIVVMSKGQY